MKPENKGAQTPPKKPYESSKRSYTTPQLTVHGDVAKLTGALGSGTKDGLSGSSLL